VTGSGVSGPPPAGTPSSSGVHFPPPLLYVAGFVLGLLLERAVRLRLIGGHGPRAVGMLGGWLAIAVGLGVMLWAIVTFMRARTAVLPNQPASRLVTTGLYARSRNPMYVGLTLAYVGLALLTNRGWPLVFLPLVLVTLHGLVIRREERYLSAAFPGEYAAYRQRVRRWL
jgi:protein-S-isoprenylcysteine O-methyltransferase Ste14